MDRCLHRAGGGDAEAGTAIGARARGVDCATAAARIRFLIARELPSQRRTEGGAAERASGSAAAPVGAPGTSVARHRRAGETRGAECVPEGGQEFLNACAGLRRALADGRFVGGGGWDCGVCCGIGLPQR
jgi:hypothetical protein